MGPPSPRGGLGCIGDYLKARLIVATTLARSSSLRFVRFELQLLRQVLVHDVGQPVSAECFLLRLFAHFSECVDLSLPESSSVAGILLKLVQSLQIQIRQWIARQLIVHNIRGPDSAPDRVWSVQLSQVGGICSSGDYDNGR